MTVGRREKETTENESESESGSRFGGGRRGKGNREKVQETRRRRGELLQERSRMRN